MNRVWLLLAVAACFALYVTLNSNSTDVEPDPATALVERNQPDLAGRNVQFNQLHEDGQLHYRLNALTIRQFNEEQLTQLEQPKFHLRSDTQAPWDINAQEGFIRKNETTNGASEDMIFLRYAVQMEQLNERSGRITLRSESVYIYPDRQLAESQQNVIIDTEVGRTTAAGLSANLETGLIKLSSSDTQRVHTIVLPEQFQKD